MSTTGLRCVQRSCTSLTGELMLHYLSLQGTFTFTRFKIEVPLGPVTTKIRYRVNHGTELHFHIPGVGECVQRRRALVVRSLPD